MIGTLSLYAKLVQVPRIGTGDLRKTRNRFYLSQKKQTRLSAGIFTLETIS